MDMTLPDDDRCVVLFQQPVPDPREEPDKAAKGTPKKAEVRVTLRSDKGTSRILIEIEDGEDAVGQTHWYRLDLSRSLDPEKNAADARAAYVVLQDITATLFQRARVAEKVAAETTARVKQLEAKLANQTLENSARVKQLEGRIAAQATKLKFGFPSAHTPETNVKAMQTVQRLILTAANHAATVEERHAAAKTAAEMVEKYKLLSPPAGTGGNGP